jgi:hypothetical protein
MGLTCEVFPHLLIHPGHLGFYLVTSPETVCFSMGKKHFAKEQIACAAGH